MKMKSIFNKKILIAIATISSLSLQSCLDDDDNYAMRFPIPPPTTSRGPVSLSAR